MNETAVESTTQPRKRQSGMSYKFQRLREKIREAVETGELAGKLPGERTLARRFHVNAKTLSKALTDLAAEGLLDRSIGRGTYIKGSAPSPSVAASRWLVLVDPGDENACIVESLRRVNPELGVIPSLEPVRPSFLNQFTSVVDLCTNTPDASLRNLLVRNMPVVAVNRDSSAYSVNSVQVDTVLGLTRLCRDLILAGHRRLGAIEKIGENLVSHTLRTAATRYGSGIVIESAEPREAMALVNEGVKALVCGSAPVAATTRNVLTSRGINIPGDVSLMAVGCGCPPIGCSGYYVECDRIAETVVGLLKETPLRPVTLWLSGTWTDRGTLSPISMPVALGHLGPALEPQHAVQ